MMQMIFFHSITSFVWTNKCIFFSLMCKIQDCGMTFKLKHSLKKHQLVHKPEFGHTCDFCGKKFKVGVPIISFFVSYRMSKNSCRILYSEGLQDL